MFHVGRTYVNGDSDEYTDIDHGRYELLSHAEPMTITPTKPPFPAMFRACPTLKF